MLSSPQWSAGNWKSSLSRESRSRKKNFGPDGPQLVGGPVGGRFRASERRRVIHEVEGKPRIIRGEDLAVWR